MFTILEQLKWATYKRAIALQKKPRSQPFLVVAIALFSTEVAVLHVRTYMNTEININKRGNKWILIRGTLSYQINTRYNQGT